MLSLYELEPVTSILHDSGADVACVEHRYLVGLWDTLERLGYDWVMRLDEDSYACTSLAHHNAMLILCIRRF